jgi:AraC family transcriptional regulator
VTTASYAVRLLPRQAYDVHYTPARPQIGFAFEGQTGQHAYASSRRTPFRALPNSAAFVPAGCDVASQSAMGGEYLSIQIHTADTAGLPDHPLNNHADAGALQAARGLRRQLLTGGPVDHVELEHMATALLNCLIGSIGPATKDRARGWMTPARMARLDALIEARLHENVSVRQLADGLNLSAGFFGRAFKAATEWRPMSTSLIGGCPGRGPYWLMRTGRWRRSPWLAGSRRKRT